MGRNDLLRNGPNRCPSLLLVLFAGAVFDKMWCLKDLNGIEEVEIVSFNVRLALLLVSFKLHC
jgi:hypothetical protein